MIDIFIWQISIELRLETLNERFIYTSGLCSASLLFPPSAQQDFPSTELSNTKLATYKSPNMIVITEGIQKICNLYFRNEKNLVIISLSSWQEMVSSWEVTVVCWEHVRISEPHVPQQLLPSFIQLIQQKIRKSLRRGAAAQP